MNQVISMLAIVIIALTISMIISLLLALPVMWLWNWLIPDLFHGPAISWWQAWGISLLTALLFKSYNTETKKSK